MLDPLASRRRFLQFLAASPLAVHAVDARHNLDCRPDGLGFARLERLITDPKQALDVFDFEPVMHNTVPPAHFGFMATGIDDEVTLRVNRAGFEKFQLLPRRLVDISKVDMRTEILGTTYDSPIFVCPTSSNKAFIRTVRSPSRRPPKGQPFADASTVATTSIEAAIEARGAAVWYQLYRHRNGKSPSRWRNEPSRPAVQQS